MVILTSSHQNISAGEAPGGRNSELYLRRYFNRLNPLLNGRVLIRLAHKDPVPIIVNENPPQNGSFSPGQGAQLCKRYIVLDDKQHEINRAGLL